MSTTTQEPATKNALPTITEWKAAIDRFQEPSIPRAVFQLVNTIVPIVALWYAMSLVIPISLWLAVPMAAVVGGLMVRVFIFFHDCGHGSFFRSRLANDVTGFVTGVITFTPFYDWRWDHAKHHATAGDLNKRGTGDVWTMTVQEYLESSRWQKFAYRLARNPFILFVFAPIYLFLIRQRFISKSNTKRERHSVWWMNLALLAVGVLMSLWLGTINYLILQGIAVGVAGAAGIWLFYVQHQFEDAYWERSEDWDYTRAALQGSSFYELPKILRWFSGNIGYHHIHHLSPRVPNYNLERCHRSAAIFDDVERLTLWSSLRSARLHLWDEGRKRLITFGQARKIRQEELRARAAGAAAQVAAQVAAASSPKRGVPS